MGDEGVFRAPLCILGHTPNVENSGKSAAFTNAAHPRPRCNGSGLGGSKLRQNCYVQCAYSDIVRVKDIGKSVLGICRAAARVQRWWVTSFLFLVEQEVIRIQEYLVDMSFAGFVVGTFAYCA